MREKMMYLAIFVAVGIIGWLFFIDCPMVLGSYTKTGQSTTASLFPLVAVAVVASIIWARIASHHDSVCIMVVVIGSLITGVHILSGMEREMSGELPKGFFSSKGAMDALMLLIMNQVGLLFGFLSRLIWKVRRT